MWANAGKMVFQLLAFFELLFVIGCVLSYVFRINNLENCLSDLRAFVIMQIAVVFFNCNFVLF